MPRRIRMPCHSSQKPQMSRAGLSLLEVIIATVILAVSATLLVRLIGAGDKNAKRADQRITAQMICQNKMDEIVASIEPFESMESTASPYYPDWYWSVSIEDLNSKNDTTVNRLSLVEVGVFFRQSDEGIGNSNQLDSQSEDPIYTLRRVIRTPKPSDQPSDKFRSGGF
jgi:type II secretory pathway pseudopilin PulG